MVNEFEHLLETIGKKISGAWFFSEKTPVFSDELINTLLSKKIHHFKLYDDIDWYIVQHSKASRYRVKNIKEISSVYLLIEVNGELCEECLNEELIEILNIQAYGGSVGKRRVEKAFWEAIEYIKKTKGD